MGKFARRAVLTLLFAALACGARSDEPTPSLQIESFKVVSADVDGAKVEFTASVSAPATVQPLFVGVTAKSRDGTIFSEGFTSALVTPGQQIHFEAIVSRPQLLEAFQTDHLIVMLFQPKQAYPYYSPLANARLEWQHDWTARETAPKPAPEHGLVLSPKPRLTTAQIFDTNLRDEDFAPLDHLLGEWNNASLRDANGDWKLWGFLAALDNEMGWDLKASLARIRAWKKYDPHSPGAAIAEARYWYNDAWHIMGCHCHRAAEPDPVAVKIFNQRMAQAEKELLDSRSYASANPLWYQIYLDVAIDSRRDDQFIDKLFQEAVNRFPNYPSLYISMARRWTTDGPGVADWRKVEFLARLAVDLTRKTDGLQNYARIYVAIGNSLPSGEDALMGSRISWPALRASFREMIKHYPSVYNYNQFASFACRAGDKETYLTLIAELGDRVIPGMWPTNFSVELCNHHFMQSS